MAYVTHPLSDVYFLSYFSFLVVCRKNRLLDGVTSLSVLAQAASSLISSVKNIIGDTPFDSLLSEFPDLSQPESTSKCATALFIISGVYPAHRSPVDHGN
jgi:hypothetical protein